MERQRGGSLVGRKSIMSGLNMFQKKNDIDNDGESVATAETYESLLTGIATMDTSAYNELSVREKQVYRDVRELKSYDKDQRKLFWELRRRRLANQPLPPLHQDTDGTTAVRVKNRSRESKKKLNASMSFSMTKGSSSGVLITGGLMEGSSFMYPTDMPPPQMMPLQGSTMVLDTTLNDINNAATMTSGGKSALSWTGAAFDEPDDDEDQEPEDEEGLDEMDGVWVPEDHFRMDARRALIMSQLVEGESEFGDEDDDVTIDTTEQEAIERERWLNAEPQDVKRRLASNVLNRQFNLSDVERLPRPAMPPAGVDLTDYQRVLQQRRGLGDFTLDRDALWRGYKQVDKSRMRQTRAVLVKGRPQRRTEMGRRRRTTCTSKRSVGDVTPQTAPDSARSVSTDASGSSIWSESTASEYSTESYMSRGTRDLNSDSSDSDSDQGSSYSDSVSSRPTTASSDGFNMGSEPISPISRKSRGEGSSKGLQGGNISRFSPDGLGEPLKSNKSTRFNIDDRGSDGSADPDPDPLSSSKNLTSTKSNASGTSLINYSSRRRPPNTPELKAPALTGEDLLVWPILEYMAMPAAEYNVDVLCTQGALRLNLQERQVGGGSRTRRATVRQGRRRSSVSTWSSVFLVHSFRPLSNAEKQNELKIGDEIIAVEGIPIGKVLEHLSKAKGMSLSTYVMAHNSTEAIRTVSHHRSSVHHHHHHHDEKHKLHGRSEEEGKKLHANLPVVEIIQKPRSTVRRAHRPSMATKVDVIPLKIETPTTVPRQTMTMSPSQILAMAKVRKSTESNNSKDHGDENHDDDDSDMSGSSNDDDDDDDENTKDESLSVGEDSITTATSSSTPLDFATGATGSRRGQRKNALYRAMFFVDRHKLAHTSEEISQTVKITLRRKRELELHESVLKFRRERIGAGTPMREQRQDDEDDKGLDSAPDVVAIHPI